MLRLLLSVLLMGALGCAARHDARGLVLSVDQAAASVTISHEPIAGYMDAMVMPFTAASARELNDVQPGDRIAFRVRSRKGRTRIDRVRLLSAAVGGTPAVAAAAAAPAVRVGQPVPEFSLTDHRGGEVTLSSLRGKVVALAFIYTRCPLPDYCPRLMTNFRAVRERLGARLGRDLVLLTVTFDPQHDTSETLTQYARRYGADGVDGWHFLTGSRAAIARVCGMFGVEFWPDEGLITHTLRTAVVDRRGRLAASVEGKDYSGAQLSDLVASVLTTPRQ